MVNEGMLLFLSKESISEHIEYMYKIKAEISIIEKSLPGICAKSFAEIMKSKIDFECKKELKEKYTDYLSHKLYFDSFALNDRPGPEIKRYYSSEDSFCYEMLEKSKSARGGFMYVTKEKRRGIRILHSSESKDMFLRCSPLLALDLEEHSYFRDYGFKRELYLRAAISRLNLSLLFVDERS